MGADDFRSTVIEDVFKVTGLEAVIDRDQNRSDLRNRIITLQV